MNRVSSGSVAGFVLLALLWPLRMHAQGAGPLTKGGPPAPAVNPQKLFSTGEAALRENKLDEAERDFRAVLAADPGAAGRNAKPGLVHLRRQKWSQALSNPRKAWQVA